jgi:hypothetical protein
VEEIRIYDEEGEEKDWDWLAATFGKVRVQGAELSEGVSAAYRIVKLQERTGPAVQVVNVADRHGEPLAGVTVVRHWPDAPGLPGWPAPASVWLSRGVFGKTNENGDIGFGMGQGDFYFLPTEGASSVWVADESGPSDLIRGLGMIGGSNHRHLDVSFRLVGPQPLPEEPPQEPPAQPPEKSPEQPPEEPSEQPEIAPEEPSIPPSLERWQKFIKKLDEIIALLQEQDE